MFQSISKCRLSWKLLNSRSTSHVLWVAVATIAHDACPKMKVIQNGRVNGDNDDKPQNCVVLLGPRVPNSVNPPV